MKDLFKSLSRIFSALCVVAFFINIGMLSLSHFIVNPTMAAELEILALINMILLSFVLLRDPK